MLSEKCRPCYSTLNVLNHYQNQWRCSLPLHDNCFQISYVASYIRGASVPWTVLSVHSDPLVTSRILYSYSSQWRHNERDSVSNHQPHQCLLTVYSSADQRKHQSFASLAFVRRIHRGPVNSPHKWPVTRKMFPFDDVIMNQVPPLID